MTRRLPIRARLTLWYSTVLALCLVAFGMTIWFSLHQSLISAKHSELEARLRSLRTFLIEQSAKSGVTNEAIREEVSEFSAGLPSEYSVDLSDSAGSSLFRTSSRRDSHTVVRDEILAAGDRTFRIRIAVSLEAEDAMLQRLGRILVLSVPLALLAASVGGYWLSGRALKPVREMALAARTIGSADLSARLPVPAVRDELSLLAEMWNEMLGRLEDSVGRIRRFTSDASHDLRTPLATIRASAEISLRRQRDPQDYRLTLEGILRQTDRATSLVENLLTLARADSGQTGAGFAPLDMAPLVVTACDTLRPMAQAKNLDLRLELGNGSVWVNGDSEVLTRVVLALVDNAIKNTDGGGIDVKVATKGHLATLTVSDTGRGIDVADLPHIFDRFYRGDKSRSTANGGFGLGLAISRESVAVHRGVIDVESTLGRGARFTVSLPLVREGYDG